MKNKNAVELRNVSVERDGNLILDSISWSAEYGKCSAIIGPNGAGKSTLISIISGYTWVSEGEVFVLGNKYGHVDIGEIRKEVGIISQSRIPEIPNWMRIMDVTASGLYGTIMIPPYEELSDSEWHEVDSRLKAAGLYDLREKYFDEVSSGEKMRAIIARALMAKHKILIMDEPTAGLDPGARVSVIKMLEKMLSEKNPPAIIIVSHHLEEIPAPLHNVLMLKNGKKIADGKPEDVLTSANLSHLFNCKINVHNSHGHYSTIVDSKEWKV